VQRAIDHRTERENLMAGTRPARRTGQGQRSAQGKRSGQGKRTGQGQRQNQGGGSPNRPPLPSPRDATRPAPAQGNGTATRVTRGAAPAATEVRPSLARRAFAPVTGAPTWFQLTTLLLSLAGLGVSAYLTITHYSTSVSLACPETGTINCEKVTTSPESIVFGIPVAVLGLAFFVFMVAVNNPMMWRSRFRVTHIARLLSVIVGMGFVLYLIYVELFKVNAICLWCTSVHVATFALFLLIVFGAAVWGLPAREEA
jgi:uncharacterized membrane protein